MDKTQNHIPLTMHSPEQTQALAGCLLKVLPPASVLALDGELGSGKTCFVRALFEAFFPQSRKNPVSSPTFTYVNEYMHEGEKITHMDMYRVENPDEILNFDPEEYFASSRITVIEWATRIRGILPANTVQIDFEVTGEFERKLKVSCPNADLLKTIGKALENADFKS